MSEPRTFKIAYDGNALQAGRMNARELAPALLSLRVLVDVAAETPFGEAPKSRGDAREREESFCREFGLWTGRGEVHLQGQPAVTLE